MIDKCNHDAVLVLCEACSLRNDIDRLKAELAAAKEQLGRYEVRLLGKIAENAKLKELCVAAAKFPWHVDDTGRKAFIAILKDAGRISDKK